MARLALATVQARDERWDVFVYGMARGDHAALASLYDATAAPVHALVGRIVKDDAVAEEVTGDVYLQAWRQASRYDANRGTTLTWLLAIARTRAIDRLRVGATLRGMEEPVERAMHVPCSRPGPEDTCSADERRRIVRAALDALPAEQRDAVELAYYDGLSHTEIATRLEEPLGTVKTRIRLAMTKLRDALSAVGSPR